MLDLDHVRSHFPALDQGWSLFDNAGGSVPLAGVIDAVAEFMARWPVQLGATYDLSAEATARVRRGHEAMAKMIGAAAGDGDGGGEVVLGPSTTANLRMLATALCPLWNEGDEVIVTNLDHETNIGPWRRLEENGIVVREWRFRPETLALELEDLEKLLGERTRLVAFSHCSNIVGRIHDVAAAARLIRDAGALSCVDGVAFAPHRRVNVQTLGVDFYAFSLYKCYGPHIALLYGRREHLLRAKGQYHFFHAEDEVPIKFEPGNPNHELAASLPAIPAYFEALAEHHGVDGIDAAFSLVREHEERLAARFLDFLKSKKNVRILGPETASGAVRVPTISFVVDGVDAATIPPHGDRERLAFRYGHFYAYRLIRDLGLLEQNGVVRVSMVHFNTPEEVDRLIALLDRVL